MNEEPHESVQRAMSRMRPGSLISLSEAIRRPPSGCPRCRENKQVADRYRRERDHLARTCARYERRNQWRDAVLLCHVVAYTLAAWALTQLWPTIAQRWAGQ